MPDPRITLQKIVALKRQKAEQQFQTLQHDMNDLKATIRDMNTRLDAINGPEVCDELRLLAYQRGHIELLIAGIKKHSQLISKKKVELDFARDGLRRALYSQDQIQRDS